MNARRGEAAAFIERAKQHTADECLLWPFAVLKTSGYPMSKHGTVHSIVCAHAHGPRPSDAEVAHSCGTKLCIAQAHLRWASRAENERDKIRMLRSNRGERHGCSKLQRDAVFAIRRSCGTNKEIAAAFGISQAHVSNIKNYKAWAWL